MNAHHCELPPEEDIIVKYIDSGLFVFKRRIFRRWLIVDPLNYRSMAFLKSRAAIRYEQQRHLQYYYNTIHPFSKFRSVWETIVLTVIGIFLMILPMEVASTYLYDSLFIPTIFLDVMLTLDLIFEFFTGFFHQITRKIILSKKKIAINYIKGFFILDAFSCLNIELVMTFSSSAIFSKMVVFSKLLRISTFMIYMERFRERHQISMYKFKVFKLIVIPSVLLMWLGSAFFMVGLVSNEKWLQQKHKNSAMGFLVCYQRASNYFFLLGDDILSKYSWSIILETTSMFLGVLYYLFMMAQILQIVNKYNSSANKYYQITQEMGEYMKYKNLPDHLQTRILDFFLYKFQKNYYKEKEIMSTISEQLRQAIYLHTCKSLLESVVIFKGLPTTLLIRIVTCMKSEIYLPNDVIVNAGNIGDSMFFIATGTVAIYTGAGKEVAHLVDGSHFGEIALVMDNEQRVASVVAVEACELYNLSRKDFLKALEPYPDLYYRIKRMAQHRLQETMSQVVRKSIRQSMQIPVSQLGFIKKIKSSDIVDKD